MMRNFDDNFKGITLLANQTVAGTGSEVNGTGVALNGCTQGVLVVDAGTFGATLTFQLQTSADNGSTDTWADVFTADKTILNSADEGFKFYEATGLKQYVRVQYLGVNGQDYEVGIALIGWDASTVPVS